MRNIFSLLLLAITVSGFGQTEKPFTLAGTLKNVPDAKLVFLQYVKNNALVTDSMLVSNGSYSFRGTLAEPTSAALILKYTNSPDDKFRSINRKRDLKQVFLTPAAMQAASVDSFSNLTLKGSKANDEFIKLEGMLKPYNDKEAALAKQYTDFRTAKNEEGMKKVDMQIDSVDDQMKDVYKTYVEKSASSPIAAYVAGRYAGYQIDADKAQPLFDKLTPEAKAFPSAIDLAKRIDLARKTNVGSIAMDFTQMDTLGNPVALSSFHGKVLLVDFWASWCGPCRAENPNVVKAFNKYKDKGFYILSVSLDQPGAKEKWLKAIHDDNLTWAHVSDLKYWNNDVAVQYGIQSIPANLLLDKEGRIIGKNLRGKALEERLAEIMQ